jgi:regulation of enolase protein 1 (concanavalin A-like superfamily)
MSRVLLALMAATSAAVAAPIPKGESETERIERLFGKPVDPDKDCTFRLDGKSLTITVPDKPHTIHKGICNAPRLVRDVRGDFVAKVKAICRLPGGAKSYPCFAGMIVFQNETTFATFQVTRELQLMDGSFSACAYEDGRKIDGIAVTGSRRVEPTMPLWFRMTRQGGELTHAFSYDGVEWEPLVRWRVHVPLDRSLSVGICAGHEGISGFTATFEDLTVEPIVGEKR